MKLKKIASLALAGIMAVGMLAGCSNGAGNGNSNNGNGGTVEPSTTAVVSAVNNGQSASNDVKIDFTVDSSLDAALAKAVSVYGNDAQETEIWVAIHNMTGLESYSAREDGFTQYVDNNGFLTGDRTFHDDIPGGKDKGEDMNGRVYTLFNVKVFDALTEEAALNKVAEKADAMISELAATGKDTITGHKYYSYSYDGSISMVSSQNLDGTTTYYVAYVVNQTVTEKTL